MVVLCVGNKALILSIAWKSFILYHGNHGSSFVGTIVIFDYVHHGNFYYLDHCSIIVCSIDTFLIFGTNGKFYGNFVFHKSWQMENRFAILLGACVHFFLL